MLPPFQKQLRKRERETALLGQLDACVARLFQNPTGPGLNLETLHHTGSLPVLSARVSRSYRLILVPLAKTEVGLVYFDNHDEAYRWVDRNRDDLPTMLSKTREVMPRAPLSASLDLVPAVRATEESPLAVASAEQFRRLFTEGIARYLAYLDDEQRALAELSVKELLVIKGAAGTGKTAVAIHRVLNLARQPVLFGPTRVLYLCYNSVLAQTVQQVMAALCFGALPRHVEVATFHSWCLRLLRKFDGDAPKADDQACRKAVLQALRELPAERRAALGDHGEDFVDEEITQVVLHNGLASLQQYLDFSRHGRPSLKRAAREVVWEVWERARQYQSERGICRWSELPLRALRVLEACPYAPQYRGVVIDEGQDCSPTMVRLARRLVAEGGALTVLADPAQTIYPCGFQWTQQELRPSGGNVRWLRNNYRITREVYALARSLLDGLDDLREEVARMQPPVRSGPRPVLVAARDEQEMRAEAVERIGAALSECQPQHLAVLGGTWPLLEAIGEALKQRGLPVQVVKPARGRGTVRIQEPSVKLLTIQSAKGLDFPRVFLLGPRSRDLGGVERADLPETRRTLYVALTRASEALTVLLPYGEHHPLLELLDDQCYEIQGACGRAFVNTRGVAFGRGVSAPGQG